MKAAYFDHYGGPEALVWGTLPDPTLAPGDVLVEVHACGVNNSDLRSREGTSRWSFPMPMVLGCEFAGRIVATGSDVHGLQVGQPVTALQQFSCNTCDRCVSWRPDLCPNFTVIGTDCWGGYAELARVPAHAVIPLRGEDDFLVAAAAQCVVSTAWHMTMSLAAVRAGETVLVPSASGGVASALVQCARLAGARVVATVGNADKVAAVERLGADVVFSYRDESVSERIAELTDGQGVDAVLDTVGGERFVQHLRTLRRDGRLATCGAHAGAEVTVDVIELFQHGWRILGFRLASPEEIRTSLRYALEGVITVPVAATFPMAEAARAHEFLARRDHVGKVVLVRQDRA